MDHEFLITQVAEDGVLVEVGPLDPSRDYRVRIPEDFQRDVFLAELERTLSLRLQFKGDRLEIVELSLRTNGEPIGTRDLLQLSLPKVIRACAKSACPEFNFWSVQLKERRGIGESLRSNPLLLAKLYWFEHLTWGSPRVVIQELIDSKRTTANSLIRMAAEKYDLPPSRKNEGRLLPAKPRY